MHPRSTETKEIRISPKTDDNDISIKVKSSIKFLEKGNKVKLVMKFEGRQLQFKEQGKEVLLVSVTSVPARIALLVVCASFCALCARARA